MTYRTVVIVEDEPAAAQYLRDLLAQHFPALQVAGIAESVPAAVRLIASVRPDLVFLDVEIEQGTGFDVLAALPALACDVIFTTAYSQFALDAFEVHAVDYLLKPLDKGRVLQAVAHWLERTARAAGGEQLARLLERLQQPASPRIAVHSIEGIEFVAPEDVLYAEARGNYTVLRLLNGSSITASKKLKEMERSLPEPAFFRIHHSYVVNAACIRKYHRGRGGHVSLSNGTDLPVAAARKDDFLRQFGQS